MSLITNTSLQKLPVIQLGNKIHHRFFQESEGS